MARSRGNNFQILVPKNFQQWSTGARAMAGGFAAQSIVWEKANEAFFEKTQEFVHVDSGDLKRSGRMETHLEGVRVVSTVEYGSPEVGYAQYEINRGGDHDYMGRGWEASQGTFESAFGASWLRVIQAWEKGDRVNPRIEGV